MRNGYYSRSALCPFYASIVISKGSHVIGIACEGLDSNLGFEAQNFVRLRTKQDLRDFFQIFCADCYETCPWYKAIAGKYEKK